MLRRRSRCRRDPFSLFLGCFWNRGDDLHARSPFLDSPRLAGGPPSEGVREGVMDGGDASRNVLATGTAPPGSRAYSSRGGYPSVLLSASRAWTYRCALAASRKRGGVSFIRGLADSQPFALVLMSRTFFFTWEVSSVHLLFVGST